MPSDVEKRRRANAERRASAAKKQAPLPKSKQEERAQANREWEAHINKRANAQRIERERYYAAETIKMKGDLCLA